LATQSELEAYAEYAYTMFQALGMEGRATLVPAPPSSADVPPGGGGPIDMGSVIDMTLSALGPTPIAPLHMWVYGAVHASKSLSDAPPAGERFEVYEVFDDLPPDAEGQAAKRDMGVFPVFEPDALNIVLDTVYRRARDAAHESLDPGG